MKQKRSTRRRAAVKWLLICAAVLCVVTLVYRVRVFPAQAVHAAAEEYGLSELRPLAREWSLRPVGVLDLRANDDALLLTYAHPWYARHGTAADRGPMGWSGDAFAVDCTRAAPVHAGNLCFFPEDYMPGADNETHYVFGRVDDPEITRLTLTRGRLSSEGDFVPLEDLDVPAEAFYIRDDRRYFLLTAAMEWQDPSAQYLRLTAYDETGRELYRSELTHGGEYVFPEA